MSPMLLLLLFLVVGLGNYLMRFLPLLFALRRRERAEREASPGGLLPLVGPAVVAALLVASLLPESPVPGYGVELARNLAALILTLFVALKVGNLGLTVLTGIFAYALASVVL